MTKILAILKASWIIGQAAGWLLFGCLAVSVSPAGEPFRVEPRPLAVPLPDEPTTPGTTPANDSTPDSAGNAATGDAKPNGPPGAQDERHAPADPRPKVYVHTVHRKDRFLPSLCKPCDDFDEWWLANCDSSPFNIIPVEYESFDALPQWVREKGVPLVQRQSEATPTGWACEGWSGPEALERNWNAANPGARLRLLASRGAGVPLTSASPFDQVQKFTGAGGSFTFKPDQPINAALDDRTSIKYPSIQGRYAVANGVVTLKLDAPLPVGNYRKWLNFGFQITGGSGPENVTATTADVVIQTNRGPQKVTIQMEPQK
jgi:hypothetical protein